MPSAQRPRTEPTDDWTQLRLLSEWPEQERYELVRPVVLFGLLPAARSEQTGVSARTIARSADRFDTFGMAAFLDADGPKHALPPEIRQTIVELKAAYPAFRANEIATICFIKYGRRPSPHTVQRIVTEDPLPLPLLHRFPPYHEMATPVERRLAIIRLHSEGWSPTSIAGVLQTSRRTVYTTLHRWVAEEFHGLADRSRAPKQHARKVDLRTMETVRTLQQNPGLGEFRIHAALKQLGIELSPRTCGRILALNRKLYGLAGPATAEPHEPKPMPFAAVRRHQYWTVDVRYLDVHRLGGGNISVISILENYSRAIIASAISRRQDLSAFLVVLYAALRTHGSPEALVSDGGGIFKAKQVERIYQKLGITKEQIARRQPWQSYIETTFNIQRRMIDWHVAQATSWADLQAVHDRWVGDYNYQVHWAHRQRPDGRRSPAEVLGEVPGTVHPPEQLDRLFTARFRRQFDRAGYVRFRHWRVYGERGLAKRPAALWLYEETLTVAFHEEVLAQYIVQYGPDGKQLREVRTPRLFETRHQSPQPPLWEPGPGDWLLVLRCAEPLRRPRRKRDGVQGQLRTSTGAVI